MGIYDSRFPILDFIILGEQSAEITNLKSEIENA